MNRVLLIVASLAFQVLVYATLKDEELIDELVQLRNGKARLPKGEADVLFQYGLERELVERARKSEPLQKQLLSRLEDKSTPPEIRHSAVRHFWKNACKGLWGHLDLISGFF